MQSLAMCVALLLGGLGSLRELPKAPDGFTWREVPAINGAFLIPVGWHFREEAGKGTLAYFITQDESAPPAQYRTGTLVNVFLKNPSAPKKIEDIARALAAKYATEVEPGSFGPFRTLQCRYDVPGDSAHETARVQLLAIANPKTNAAYLVMFESPVSTWESA